MKLLKLSLENFKGIKSFTLQSHGENIAVYGDNATGKTTLFDAFLWLLFDKDSQNQANFDIKTLGPDGEPYHGLDHTVEAVLQFKGGRKLTLKKIYKEKWTKQRGSATKTFTGHTVDHFIDGIPVTKTEYTKKIAGLRGLERSYKAQNTKNIKNRLEESVVKKVYSISTRESQGEMAMGYYQNIRCLYEAATRVWELPSYEELMQFIVYDKLPQFPEQFGPFRGYSIGKIYDKDGLYEVRIITNSGRELRLQGITWDEGPQLPNPEQRVRIRMAEVVFPDGSTRAAEELIGYIWSSHYGNANDSYWCDVTFVDGGSVSINDYPWNVPKVENWTWETAHKNVNENEARKRLKVKNQERE